MVLKEFKEALIVNHNLICSNMVSYMFNTYIQKLELDLTKSNIFSTQTKCNELDWFISMHKKLVNANATSVGNLRKNMKK